MFLNGNWEPRLVFENGRNILRVFTHFFVFLSAGVVFDLSCECLLKRGCEELRNLDLNLHSLLSSKIYVSSTKEWSIEEVLLNIRAVSREWHPRGAPMND
jgi:hypothetical protein